MNKKNILDKIKANNICVLATCYKDIPRAATVIYYSDGKNIFINTFKKSRKVSNIKNNRNIFVVIDKQGRENWGIQANGICRILNKDETNDAIKKFNIKSRILNESNNILLKIKLKNIEFYEKNGGSLKLTKLKV